ncbi:MAG TPA: Stk1 family PASTA domain-containing Ser/Thr kinase [Streptosporangiaceae bacterium]|nr:Stk1 family PASTA domain-containing Ser/Thr kinase [Streptosporangiaceae bacterium]
MDTALSPPVGQLLGGRYQVGSQIARGGMATVYLGTDTRLDRVVALKIAHLELSDDAEFVRRFIGEARSAARLSSPNVVAVYDQGSEGPLHYIAMEYVPGRTLRDLLAERGRLSPAEAIEVMSGVLSGLAAAHQAGYAHRDVKPENALLSPDGAVKVADFGLARSVAGAVQTKGGMIIGTAAYLAPEQVTGGASDARTDVYAAGIMLFELLTGYQPYTGESPLAVAYKHVNEVVPPPSSLMPGLAPALDALVAMATSRDPDLRPSSAGEFLRAIDEVRKGQGLPRSGPYRAAHRYPDELDSGPYQAAYRTMAAPELPAAINHTLVVPPEAALDPYSAPHAAPYGAPGRVSLGSGGGGHDEPAYEALYASPERAEPMLQRVLFGRRFWYALIGFIVVAAVGAGTWWMVAGRYTKVPSMRGLSAASAASDLRGLGLASKIGKGKYSSMPRGEIITTSPASGAKVTSGSVVTLVPSLGPRMIMMPNVTGMSLARARQAVRVAHLTLGKIRRTVSGTVPSGHVITSHPTAFTKWPQDKPVELTVSLGPGLPDFVGQTLPFAQAAAGSGGYRIQPVTVKNSAPAGQIIGQSPRANTPIRPGEVVTVRVSQGPPQANVPDVKGLQLQQAIQALRHAGFQVKVNHQGPGSRVGSYSPTGTAPKGSTITLNVGFFSFF